MPILSSSEVQTLSDYKFISDELKCTRDNLKNTELLCVKRGQGLTTIKTTDINCFEIFKSYFNCGKLARCDYTLESVANYLERFDLSELPEAAAEKVHSIASRALFYGKSLNPIPTLWKKIATETKDFKVNYVTEFRGDRDWDCIERIETHTLYLTPKSHIIHLSAQFQRLTGRQALASKIAGFSDYKTMYTPLYGYLPANETNLQGASFKITLAKVVNYTTTQHHTHRTNY